MRKHLTRLAAALMAAILVFGQYGIMPVKAEESQDMKVTDLTWNEKGQGSFSIPTDKRTSYTAYVYDANGEEVGVYRDGMYHTYGKSRNVILTYDLYHLIKNSGTYTFKVVTMNGDEKATSERSAEFTYTKPDEKLPVPEFSVTKDGKVTCEALEGYTLETDYGIYYILGYLDSSGEFKEIDKRGAQWGTNELTYDFSKFITDSDKVYCVKVNALSRDIFKYLDSDISDYKQVDPDAVVIIQDNDDDDDDDDEPEVWIPSTPGEIKIYAAYSGEEIKYTADKNNAYTVTFQNSIQGEKCFASFEAVLENYTIGRTYNILPSGEFVYKADSKARITLSIPESMQADNRDFRMICVTENGQAIVLKDLDSNSKTITFETDTYYAFALVYKDNVKQKLK